MVKGFSVALLVALLVLSVVFAAHADGERAKSLETLPGANNAAGQVDPRAVIGSQHESFRVNMDNQDMVGANSVAGQMDPNAVVKIDAPPMFDGDNVTGVAPATADYSGGMGVTAGKSYHLDLFWCYLRQGRALVAPKPSWARTAIIGLGGVTVKPDGSFSAKADGYILIQWWDDTCDKRRWVMSIVVRTKNADGSTIRLDDI